MFVFYIKRLKPTPTWTQKKRRKTQLWPKLPVSNFKEAKYVNNHQTIVKVEKIKIMIIFIIPLNTENKSDVFVCKNATESLTGI